MDRLSRCLRQQLADDGDHIRLQFKNVWVDDDTCYKVTIDLGGVRGMTRNGEAVDAMSTEGEGSSVIGFERSGHTAALVVDWRSYTARTNETCVYDFSFKTFEL